jgi:hypothetical protein
MAPSGLNRVLTQLPRAMHERQPAADSDRLLDMVVDPRFLSTISRAVGRRFPLGLTATTAWLPGRSLISVHNPATSVEEDTTWT